MTVIGIFSCYLQLELIEHRLFDLVDLKCVWNPYIYIKEVFSTTLAIAVVLKPGFYIIVTIVWR